MNYGELENSQLGFVHTLPDRFYAVTNIIPDIACVAGVERGRENLGARESVWGAPHALTRAQIPPSPSPFNAGHAGYTG